MPLVVRVPPPELRAQLLALAARPPDARRGDIVQAAGSPHRWFLRVRNPQAVWGAFFGPGALAVVAAYAAYATGAAGPLRVVDAALGVTLPGAPAQRLHCDTHQPRGRV
jgi:hypothetical protein